MRSVTVAQMVDSDVNNVHISFPHVNLRLVNTAQTLGNNPCVSLLFSVLSTYERCSTVIFLSERCLSQGLYPRVLTILTFMHILD